MHPFTARVGDDLLLKPLDPGFVKHKLPTDDIYIPPKQIPEQENDLNYLLEADEKWQLNRPLSFCVDHLHN